MKKFVLGIVALFIFGLVGSVQAWTLHEFVTINEEGSSHEYGHVWFEIDNNSTENIVGFGVGIDLDLRWADGNEYNDVYVEQRAPRHGSYGTTVGDWWSQVVHESQWSTEVFGGTWSEAFGTSEYAYIAYADPNGSSYSGSIDAGTYYEDHGFWWDYYMAGECSSPVVAVFEDSGTFYGETGYNNTNPNPATAPVPEPCTMLLMGTGLAGMVVTKLRKRKK